MCNWLLIVNCSLLLLLMTTVMKTMRSVALVCEADESKDVRSRKRHEHSKLEFERQCVQFNRIHLQFDFRRMSPLNWWSGGKRKSRNYASFSKQSNAAEPQKTRTQQRFPNDSSLNFEFVLLSLWINWAKCMTRIFFHWKVYKRLPFSKCGSQEVIILSWTE